MSWINSRAEAGKFVKLLSDNRVLPSEWKYAIPLYIVQHPLPIVINAKNLADGIIEHIELYYPDFPQDKIAVKGSEDYQVD